jgi:hypothetical protein
LQSPFHSGTVWPSEGALCPCESITKGR